MHKHFYVTIYVCLFLKSFLRESHPVGGEIRFPVPTKVAHTVSMRLVEAIPVS